MVKYKNKNRFVCGNQHSTCSQNPWRTMYSCLKKRVNIPCKLFKKLSLNKITGTKQSEIKSTFNDEYKIGLEDHLHIITNTKFVFFFNSNTQFWHYKYILRRLLSLNSNLPEIHMVSFWEIIFKWAYITGCIQIEVQYWIVKILQIN